jgi:hypothetical protein
MRIFQGGWEEATERTEYPIADVLMAHLPATMTISMATLVTLKTRRSIEGLRA